MKISSNLARTISKKLSITILALTFLMGGFAPALVGAEASTATPAETTTTTTTDTTATTPTATTATTTASSGATNACGKTPKALPDAPDTTKMSPAEKKKAEAKYLELQKKYWPTVPACLVLYSSQGKYKQAIVSIVPSSNSPSTFKNAVCGGKKFEAKGKQRNISINLTKAPKLVKCSAGNYRVAFVKDAKKSNAINVNKPSTYIAVAVQGKHCTYVNKKAGVTRIETITDTNSCPMDAAALADPVDKAKSILTVEYSPNPVVRGEKTMYRVKLASADPEADPMNFKDCTGVLTQTVNSKLIAGKDGKTQSSSTQDLNFRYSKKYSACVYEKYQTAKQNNVKDGLYAGVVTRDVSVTYKGNDYQEPVTATATVTFKDKAPVSKDKKDTKDGNSSGTVKTGNGARTQ